MANLRILDGSGAEVWMRARGDGSAGDPFGLHPFDVAAQSLSLPSGGNTYAVGEVVGGLQSLTDVNIRAGSCVTLEGCQVSDRSGSNFGLRIYFFHDTPAGGTYTDGAALAWDTGDSAKKAGHIDILTTDWVTDDSQSSVNLPQHMPMPVTNRDLTVLVVVTSGTPTLAAADLTIHLVFRQH